jgi:hypothetical protein
MTLARGVLLGVLVGLAGCFTPGYSDQTQCGPAGECPPGRACVSGRCVAADAAPGGPSVPDASTFVVASVDPPDGATVNASKGVTVFFSRAANPTSVNGGSFTVSVAGGGAVVGTVSVDPAGLFATFTPNPPLDLRTAYVVRVGPGVTDATGAALAPFTSSFSVDYVWRALSRLSSVSNMMLHAPAVAVNGNGDAVVGWTNEPIGGRRQPHATVAPAGHPWAQYLGGGNTATEDLDVAIGAEGDALALWTTTGVAASIVPVSAHTVASSAASPPEWTVQTLENPDSISTRATSPRVVIDGSGYATALWVEGSPQSAPPSFSRALLYVAKVDWTVPQAVASLSGFTGSMVAGANAMGNALVVFGASDPAGVRVHADWYSGGWASSFADIDGPPASGYVSNTPQAAMGPGSSAFATWTRGLSGVEKMLANHAEGGVWDPAGPVPIDLDDQDPSWSPGIAADGGGGAVAVWLHGKRDGLRDVWANRYSSPLGWSGSPEKVSTGGTASAEARVAVDELGDAVAVWTVATVNGAQVWSARALAGRPWGAPVLVSDPDSITARDLRLAVDGHGRVLLVWVTDSSPSVWATWLR